MSYIGTTKIGKMYLGTVEIAKAYLGNTLVFQAGGGPTPPSPTPILPSGYTELAYVSTDSAAYIDTGVAGASDLEITARFRVGSYVQYGSIYGNYIDGDHYANRVILGNETILTVAGGNNISQNVSGFAITSVHTLTVNSTTATLNGTATSIAAATKTSNTNNICLGNRSVDNPVSRDISLRIYSFEIKKNGTTILNYVPAKRDSDDAIGFYDLVSETFMKSLTGTEFTAGPANDYTPVNYIETDGNCYITTGITATPPRSSEIKVKMGSNTACSLLAGFMASSGSDSKQFALARYNASKYATFAYYATYGSGDGMPSVSYSIDNDLPFIVKTDIMKGAQHISVKQEDSNSWTTVSKSNNNTVNSSYGLVILGAYRNSTYENLAPSGTRLYYCKIYKDETYGGLVFDGVPCYCNGAYGLWDKVSGTFKGNSGSGTFTGQ